MKPVDLKVIKDEWPHAIWRCEGTDYLILYKSVRLVEGFQHDVKALRIVREFCWTPQIRDNLSSIMIPVSCERERQHSALKRMCFHGWKGMAYSVGKIAIPDGPANYLLSPLGAMKSNAIHLTAYGNAFLLILIMRASDACWREDCVVEVCNTPVFVLDVMSMASVASMLRRLAPLWFDRMVAAINFISPPSFYFDELIKKGRADALAEAGHELALKYLSDVNAHADEIESFEKEMFVRLSPVLRSSALDKFLK